jgi:hypothetical protein
VLKLLNAILRKLKNCILYFLYYLKYFLLKLSGEADEIITIIDGGLGSQMSQYAMGQEIQRITGIQVSYDLEWYDNCGKDILGKENRLFELNTVFNINVRKAEKKKIKIYKYLFNKHNNTLIKNLDDVIMTPPLYLGGYWSSEKYTNYNMENLRKLFTFQLSLDDKNKKMLDKILSYECSVAVQIRMGDYIGSALDVATPEYFHRAIEYICKYISIPLPTPPHQTIVNQQNNNVHFFVFCTDTKQCKDILGALPYEFTYMDINDNDHGAHDMYLMSHCHHFIISNSTFGIWPAKLSDRSKNKLVIQPDKWLKTDTKKIESRDNWITMEC